MTAYFYINNSDRIVVNKVIDKQNEATVRYKADTTIEKPTFICDSDKFEDGINYIYVGGNIKRYYFVEDVEMTQGRVYISCSVDPLMSFKDKIYEQTCVIKRNTSKWNLYLNDERMNLYNVQRVLTFPFANGFRNFYDPQKKGSFVLVLSGSGEAPTP